MHRRAGSLRTGRGPFGAFFLHSGRKGDTAHSVRLLRWTLTWPLNFLFFVARLPNLIHDVWYLLACLVTVKSGHVVNYLANLFSVTCVTFHDFIL
jgi:hypothetical protein